MQTHVRHFCLGRRIAKDFFGTFLKRLQGPFEKGIFLENFPIFWEKLQSTVTDNPFPLMAGMLAAVALGND